MFVLWLVTTMSQEYNKYHIIRAVNYCEMKREELLKEAIEKRVTIGEIYYERLKEKEDENNDSKNNPRT